MTNPVSREIRVFLSSTFRDMEAERSHLIKVIFPRVRAACQARQVGFTEIDLRWGVTEEESKNGATVEICLKEIDRCRDFPPFFIGFLGERYGWVPREEDLLAYWERHADSPYATPIKDAVKRGISVTELEMELAVFGNDVTPPAFTLGDAADDRALFLLRDAALSHQFYAEAQARAAANPALPRVRESDFLNPGNGRLEILKNRIRESGLLKIDDYASVEAFGAAIEDHLLAALDRYFPADEVPSEDERIEVAHRGFQHHRLANFLPRPDIKAGFIEAIQQRIELPRLGPLLVTGPSGQGKSALMADLARAIAAGEVTASRPLRVIDHYVGADGVGSLEGWIRRLLYRFQQLLDDKELVIPDAPKDQKEAVITWAARAARSANAGGSPEAPVSFVLLVDALDQLADQGRDLSLLMPEVLGADCVVICSAAEGTPAIDAAAKFSSLAVPPLTTDLRVRIIDDTLGRFRKKLPPTDAQRLAAGPASGSPLFLTLALEELRVDAHHETLSALVDEILQSADAGALFLHNFLLDEDYARPAQPDLAVRFMALLSAAHDGLTEQQLADLLALPDDPVAEDSGEPRLPQANLSHVLNNFGGFLLDKGDRRAPMHRMFGEVALQHLGEEAVRIQLYNAFAGWADRADQHKAEALHQVTWLATHANADRAQWRTQLVNDLEKWIGIPQGKILQRALEVLDEVEKELLTQRWEATCAALPEEGIEEAGGYWLKVSSWLQEITFNRYETSRRVTEALVERLRPFGEEHPFRLEALGRLGVILTTAGLYSRALEIEKSLLEARKRLLGPEHKDTLAAMGNLANTLFGKGHYAGSRALLETALQSYKRQFRPDNPDTLITMANLALTLDNQGFYAEARALGETVLESQKRQYGPEHPFTLSTMSNLALTLGHQGDHSGERALLEAVLNARQRTLGWQHPDTLKAISNLANAMFHQSDFDSAATLKKAVLDGFERMLGPEHHNTLIAAGDLAMVLFYQGDLNGAKFLQQTAVDKLKLTLGPEHPHTLTCMINLAWILDNQGDNADARALQETILEARQRRLGQDHPDTLVAMSDLATSLSNQGDYVGAQTLQEALLEARNRILGPKHPATLQTITNLASTLFYQGDHVRALMLTRNNLETQQTILGREHPDTLVTTGNLSVIYLEIKNYAASRTLKAKRLHTMEKIVGDDHPDIKNQKNQLQDIIKKIRANRNSIDLLTHPDFENTIAFAKGIAKSANSHTLEIIHLEAGLSLALQRNLIISDFEMPKPLLEVFGPGLLQNIPNPDEIERQKDSMKLSAQTKDLIQRCKKMEFIEFIEALARS